MEIKVPNRPLNCNKLEWKQHVSPPEPNDSVFICPKSPKSVSLICVSDKNITSLTIDGLKENDTNNVFQRRAHNYHIYIFHL